MEDFKMWVKIIPMGVMVGLGFVFLVNGLGLPSKYGYPDASGENLVIGILLFSCCYGWFLLIKEMGWVHFGEALSKNYPSSK